MALTDKTYLDSSGVAVTTRLHDAGSSKVQPAPVLYGSNGTPLEGAFGSGYVQVVPTCHTSSQASGNVLAATEILAAICRADDVPGLLASITCARLDSATGVDIRVWLLKANSSIGAENAALSIADADMDDILGYVDFAAANFVIGGNTNCFAQKAPDRPLPLIPVSASDDVYFGISTLGTVDLVAATDLVLSFHRI